MKLLAAKITRLYRIWKIQLYSNLMRRMAYPINFYLMSFGSLFQMLLSIAFVKIIFNFIDNLAGWNYYQALMVVASYMLIEGLMWGTCAYLNGLKTHVLMGTLDGLLVKPIDNQYIVSIWQSDPEDWMRVITALIIFIISVNGLNLPLQILIINLFYYLFLIFNAYLIVYSITLIIRTITFWTTETDGLWKILESFTRLSQYPTDIFYNKLIRLFFTTIIPLSFIATIPAKVLIHGPNIFLISSSTLLAIIFFMASRKFFKFGLKHYSSASS